jgi:hypothetical protein
MSTPQNPDTAAQAIALTANLKHKKVLSPDEIPQMQALQLQLQRLLPSAQAGPRITARPRQFSREQQEGL